MSKKTVRTWEEPVEDITEADVEEEFRFNPKSWERLPRGVRKVRVNLWLDDNVVAEFKARAQNANAAPYQTQINQALREALGKSASPSEEPRTSTVVSLDDPQLIEGLAEKIGAYIVAHSDKNKRRPEAA